MQNLEKKHNIISIDEDFIGTVENLKNFFIDSLIYDLKTDDDTDNKISNISIVNEILRDLQDYCCNTTVIRVCYNPMGTYFISENLDR